MTPLSFSETSDAFKRFWARVERRVEKVDSMLMTAPTPLESLEHDWKGAMEAWRGLVSTPQGRQEVVFAQKKIGGGGRETLLNRAAGTGHGPLVEHILCVHDTLDPGHAWAGREDHSGRTPISHYPQTISVLCSMARRVPGQIGATLDRLLEDTQKMVEHGDWREIAQCVVAFDTWSRVVARSEDIIRPAVHDWITTRSHPRVGHAEVDAALGRLGSFTRAQQLTQVATTVRANGPNDTRHMKRKI